MAETNISLTTLPKEPSSPAAKADAESSRHILDPSLYAPSPEEVKFFKSQTSIGDDEALKEHIIEVQKEAWNVVPYVCIRQFGFTRLTISRQPKYPEFLKLGKERPGAIFVEFACCFGTDARKAVADGYPVENVVACDIEPEFWKLGHKLFRSTSETFPVPFVHCDVFNPMHIAPRPPVYGLPDSHRPVLSTLTSLTPLQGHVSAIHVSQFFHLFTEEEQLASARALASLLSPEPGSVIFGWHPTKPTKGNRSTPNLRGKMVFCHIPESWRDLWDGEIFEKGTIDVYAELNEIRRDNMLPSTGDPDALLLMSWCVKRK